MFKIISESGVAAGVRRIEAVTGKGVLEYINNSDRLIEKTAAALKINQINEIDHKAESVMAQCRELEKAVDSFKEKMAAAKANNIMTGIKHIGEISLITAQVDGMGADEMKSMADKIKVRTVLLLWVLKLTVRLRLLLWRQRRLLSWAFIAVRLLRILRLLQAAAAAVSLIWRKAAAVTRARLMTRWLRLTKSLRNRLSN